MAALTPDYDSDPKRAASWDNSWIQGDDAYAGSAHRLHGVVLDIGCGEGLLATLLPGDATWFGVDSSPAQLEKAPRPAVLADARALPFRDAAIVVGVFGDAAVTVEPWDGPFNVLPDRDAVRAYARHHALPAHIADHVGTPLTLTKRGCLVWAVKRDGSTAAG